MSRFVGITFTGVDQYTDLNKLSELQFDYPYAEFGILFSAKYAENGNRYFDPNLLKQKVDEIFEYDLKLSAHLCGRIARDAYQGEHKEFIELIGGPNSLISDIFSRVQLNLASWSSDQPINLFGNPFLNAYEYIIQQKSANDCKLYELNKNNTMVSMLCDPSGGKGIDSEIITYKSASNEVIGYAGGINVDNVIDKLNQIHNSKDVTNYWIDMESSVRDANDRFDLNKIEDILIKVDKWRKSI